MPINPMTGLHYDANNVNDPNNPSNDEANPNSPIGTQALAKRPPITKALDFATGGATFFTAVGYRSHTGLLTKGEYKSDFMKKAGMHDWFEKSFAKTIDDPGAFKATAHDLMRDQATRFNPFTWNRAPSMQSFNPETQIHVYAGINKVLRKTGMLDKLPDAMKDSEGNLGHIIDPKFFSRMTAGSNLDRKAAKAGERALTDVEKQTMHDYLKSANPDLLERLNKINGPKVEGTTTMDELTNKDMGKVMRMGMQKGVTARMGGYYEQAVNPGGKMNPEFMRDAEGKMTNAGKGYESAKADRELGEIYKKEGWKGVKDLSGKSTSELAAKGLGKEAATKFAAKGATKLAVSLATRAAIMGAVAPLDLVGVGEVIQVAMALWMAYDVAKFAATALPGLIKAGISTVASPVKSYMGDITKPQFGMGFKPTVASTTSRSRGVNAIQNSRLNARSVLGSEAGSLYQHFG